jgi:hypothetical protein
MRTQAQSQKTAPATTFIRTLSRRQALSRAEFEEGWEALLKTFLFVAKEHEWIAGRRAFGFAKTSRRLLD